MIQANADNTVVRSQRILIAGIGNIFLGDDAFGVEVAQRLSQRPQPDGVRVADFGIRGFDLAYALLDGYDVTILVDAMPRGSAPGTLYVVEPDQSTLGVEPGGAVAIDTHAMDPVKVLRFAAAMSGQLGRVLVVGCEPSAMTSEQDMEMGMSDAVQAAVDPAVTLVESLVARILSGTYPPTERSVPAVGVQ
jgi:hydrogenase maturation protease